MHLLRSLTMSDESETGPAKVVTWTKRVAKDKIKRLYESEAHGLLDTELLEDVGLQIFMRCRDIMTVTEAKRGDVSCPQCARGSRNTIIRRGRKREPDKERLACPECGWETTWLEYRRTFQRRQMNDGGAGPEFQRFMEHYRAARTPTEKMLAIDRVIHAFHVYLMQHVKTGEKKIQPTRAACVNLIDGKLTDVVAFLNDLAYSPAGDPNLIASRDAWRKAQFEESEGFWKTWRIAKADRKRPPKS